MLSESLKKLIFFKITVSPSHIIKFVSFSSKNLWIKQNFKIMFTCLMSAIKSNFIENFFKVYWIIAVAKPRLATLPVYNPLPKIGTTPTVEPVKT